MQRLSGGLLAVDMSMTVRGASTEKEEEDLSHQSGSKSVTKY